MGVSVEYFSHLVMPDKFSISFHWGSTYMHSSPRLMVEVRFDDDFDTGVRSQILRLNGAGISDLKRLRRP